MSRTKNIKRKAKHDGKLCRTCLSPHFALDLPDFLGEPDSAQPPNKKTRFSPEAETATSNAPKLDSSTKKSDVKSNSDAVKSQPTPTPAESKKSRKRAADFLDDEKDDAPEVSSSKVEQSVPGTSAKQAKNKRIKEMKKAKKRASKEAAAASSATSATTTTTEDVNGTSEQKEKKSKKSKKSKSSDAPAPTSMLAEGQRTADQEMKDDWGGFSDTDKEGKKLTSGGKVSDADDEEEEPDVNTDLLAAIDEPLDDDDVEDEGWEDPEQRSKAPIDAESKKALKKLRKKAKKNPTADDEPGVIYIGRLPHGFEEEGLNGFFGQFGDITKLRVSRNKRTGASKHYAFIEFASAEVAAIAAKSMDAYLMYKHVMKCKLVSKEQLEKMGPSLWIGANKKFRKIPHEKIEAAKLAEPKSVDEWRKKTEKEQSRRVKRAKKAKDLLGYEMKDVEMKDPQEAIERRKLLETEKDNEVEKPVAAIEDVKAATTTPKIAESPSGPDENDDSASKQLLNGLANSSPAAPIPNGAADGKDDKADSDSSSDSEDGLPLFADPRTGVVPAEMLNTDNQLPMKPSEEVLKAAEAKKKADTVSKIPEKPVNDEPKGAAATDVTLPPKPAATESGEPKEKNLSKKELKALKKKQKAEARVDENGKIKKKEKYVPPTHKKMLAKAKWVQENPVEHQKLKDKKLREEKKIRWDKKEARMQRRYENRVARREEKTKQKTGEAAQKKGRVAIGSDGAKVKGAGTKTTFD
jgi:nucleolar protein 15